MSLWKLFQSSTPSAGRTQCNLITSSVSQTPTRKTRSRLKQINCEWTRVYIISAHRRITEVVLSQSPSVCSACKLWCSPKKRPCAVFLILFCCYFLVYFVFFVFFFTFCNMIISYVLLNAWTDIFFQVVNSGWLCSCNGIKPTSDPWDLMHHIAPIHWILLPLGPKFWDRLLWTLVVL